MMAFIIIVVIASMALVLLRAITAPTVFDRILAGNVFGTNTVVLIALLAETNHYWALLDIALVYALINFVITIALLRYFQHYRVRER